TGRGGRWPSSSGWPHPMPGQGGVGALNAGLDGAADASGPVVADIQIDALVRPYVGNDCSERLIVARRSVAREVVDDSADGRGLIHGGSPWIEAASHNHEGRRGWMNG